MNSQNSQIQEFFSGINVKIRRMKYSQDFVNFNVQLIQSSDDFDKMLIEENPDVIYIDYGDYYGRKYYFLMFIDKNGVMYGYNGRSYVPFQRYAEKKRSGS